MQNDHDDVEVASSAQPETDGDALDQSSVADAPEAVEPAGDETGTGPRGVPVLIVKRAGVLTEERFAITSPCVIGRFDPGVGPIDIDLGSIQEGVYVSRKHAKITQDENGNWHIHDLGSSNGTFVLKDEFERVETSELCDGTEIALGNARFVFSLS